MEERRRVVTPVIIAACGIGLFLAWKRYKVLPRIRSYLTDPLRHKHVQMVTNVDECLRVVTRLQKDVDKYRVLGFDCEWLTVDGTRRPIALLQLASSSGLCALIRLCQLKTIPRELLQLLEDESILKVGVAPLDDAKYLLKDYDVHMRSTVDLRHLALHLDRSPDGLAKLSKSFIGVELDKNWRIRCSLWDNPTLTEAQIEYAAKDSLVAIEIYKKMFTIYKERTGNDFQAFTTLSHTYHDRPFNAKGGRGLSGLPQPKGRKNLSPMTSQRRSLATRSRPLYDNCYMEAPDGELLCTLDRAKALWYQKKGLATLVSEDPLRMRLLFEPSGRAVGQTGAYDLVEKMNQCVVCGTQENYSRKFIVPKEYRKFFPVVLKSHSSHDILLMCLECHRDSHMSDNILRQRLAILCNAPLVCHLKKLKTCANALLKIQKMPETDRTRLTDQIKEFYPDQEITEALLTELSLLDTKSRAGDNSGHAQAVTEYYRDTPESGGLLDLERMWREHFLETMKPRFLPDHWSVAYNANRLETRVGSGRLDENELIAAGLNPIGKTDGPPAT